MKRRLGWAGLAAVVGCGACCAAVPLLTAVGLGSAATALAAWIGPGTELAAGTLAGALALGVMTIRERRKKSTCSWRAAPDQPIACTADLRDGTAVQAHIDAYRAVFTRLIGTERFADGFRWSFRAEPGLEAELRALVEREHGCCRFFNFELTVDRDRIVWTTTADEPARSMVDEFFRLPERLRSEPRSGHDLAVLKHSAEAAGLMFTASPRPRPSASPCNDRRFR